MANPRCRTGNRVTLRGGVIRSPASSGLLRRIAGVPSSVRNYTELPARVYVLTPRLGPLFAVRNRVTPP